MLFKLSITGIKNHLRDYTVLFSGLVIAAGIFYMFESLATNEEFLASSNTVNVAPIIFHFGTILLSIITFVYVLYANSFLLILKQKTYAMLMMLGAKTRKIAQLVFLETFFVGIIATLVGLLVGIGLTTVVNQLLVSQLDITVKHFTPINEKAILWTLVFFLILFSLTSLINARAITKKTILQLLREQATPERIQIKPIRLLLETVIGLISLGISYYMFFQLAALQLIAIAISLVTIILGSYLLFHAVALFVLDLLKKSDRFAMKNINNFTFSQLNFRIRDFTQILTMVSILFALALGSLTVGLGFRNQIMVFTDSFASYDLVLNNAQDINQEKINALDPTVDIRYTQKEDAQTIYYNIDEFNQHPLSISSSNASDKTKHQISGNELAADQTKQIELKNLELPEQANKTMQFLSTDAFNQLDLPETFLQVVDVKNFKEKRTEIKTLVQENNKNNPSLTTENEMELSSQKYDIYQLYNGFFSGFQFMGFFLGLAFLTMLASCLMFKILSSANNDIPRYQMLRKIGTRQQLLKTAIRKELGILFLLPGLLGSLHVLFGLQMFNGFLENPYHNIWIPFAIFLILYVLYYIITVTIYTEIVLPKEIE